jgi:hypothetical protein
VCVCVCVCVCELCEGRVIQGARRSDPSPSGVVRNLTFPRSSSRPQSAPVGPYRSTSLGHRPASSCELVLVPPGRGIVSIVPKITGFSLDWCGSWEGRGGRPKSEPVVAVHPRRLERGAGRRLQFFLFPIGFLHSAQALPRFAFMSRIPRKTNVSSGEDGQISLPAIHRLTIREGIPPPC